MATEMSEKMKALERENRELKHANEILRKKICIFCSGGARPSVQDMIAFIEENSNIGVKPICKHLPIAPSTFYDHMAKWANPELLSDRAKRDIALKPEIERVWEKNYKV